MKFGKTPVSRRTLALLAATVLLATSGGYMGTRAALEYQSEWANAEFELEHLHVHLLENGRDVCIEDGEQQNTMNTVHRGDKDATAKKTKYYGDLLGDNLGYTNETHDDTIAYLRSDALGKVEPGRDYDEKIAAKNGSDVPQYLRLTIRKYWVKDGKKFTKLDPSLIKLSYDGKDYNEGPWKINKQESTSESDTYYYTSKLDGNATTADLFDTLTIDKSVADFDLEKARANKEPNVTVNESKEGNKTVITYTYDYDGCTFYIEADVQALQTHNVNDAIKSIWGVSNVSVSGETLSVK